MLLLVHQHNVAMQTGALRRSGAHIFSDTLAGRPIAARYIDHRPVLPLAQRRFVARRRIRIDHQQRVEAAGIRTPIEVQRCVLHLRGRQFVAQIDGHIVGVCELFLGVLFI